jgi:preprotein translocase subunit SecE
MKIVDYLKDTRSEMKHVSWPTQRQALVFTVIVVVVSIVTAAYLGLFDYIFTEALNLFI